MTIYFLCAFILSMICGAFFTPAILGYCKRKKLYDIPSERKIHANATPRLGGISFFPSMMLAFVAILIYLWKSNPEVIPVNIWSASFIVGLALIYVVGIIDDLVGLNASTKFTAQIIAGSLLPMTGLYVNNLYGFLGIYEIPGFVGIPLTIFVIVFISNAMNLIDGIDGLASSLSMLAFAGFLTYFVHYEVYMNTYSLLIAGMMGALVAFFYFNVFGKAEKNTKIFMGDSGSLSLGFTLGFFAVKTAMNNQNIWDYRPEAFLVPVTLIFIPIADVVRVTLYRLFKRQPLFKADKNHIHHKLMRTGLNQHQALVVILLLTIVIYVMNSLLFPTLSSTLIIGIDILIFLLVNMVINLRMKPAS